MHMRVYRVRLVVCSTKKKYRYTSVGGGARDVGWETRGCQLEKNANILAGTKSNAIKNFCSVPYDICHLHNALSFVDLNKFSLFVSSPRPCSAIHSFKLVR